jgi:hypothetical protein
LIPEKERETQESPNKPMNPKILVPWIIIAFPLGWGVYQSVLKSLPLFGMAPPAAVAPAKPVTTTGAAPGAPTPSSAAPAATPMQSTTTPAAAKASPTPP